MTQDFWASSGFALLERNAEGLRVTDRWLARFLEREELKPPPEAGPREVELHARLLASPRASVRTEELEALEDPDARENWEHFLRFRDRLLEHGSLESCYAHLFQRGSVDIAPVFVDALVETIARSMLDRVEDPWVLRAAEMLFRRQRVSDEGGQVLAADAATLEVYAETGGFGAVGKLLREQLPAVKMDVLTRENAPFYFLRDGLYSFALDITPGREGAAALARVLERWVAHLAGVRVAIEPLERIDDDRWRWHVGLDVESTAILNALYNREAVAPEATQRLVSLFRLTFADPADALPDIQGRPVYLGLAVRPDRTLKVKPQNLLVNLPFAARN
jgi:hypothetical protein